MNFTIETIKSTVERGAEVTIKLGSVTVHKRHTSFLDDSEEDSINKAIDEFAEKLVTAIEFIDNNQYDILVKRDFR